MLFEVGSHILRAFLPTPEGFVLVAAVWSVALYVWFCVGRQRAAIGREAALLTRLEQAEREHGNIKTDKLNDLLNNSPKDSLIRAYAYSLLRLRSTARIDLAAIMDSVVQKTSTWLTFPRVAPNMVMLLGLIGTVIGLAQVVQALGPQIISTATASNPQEMAHALAGQLGNLQTAFACTLHGILAAVTIGFMTNAAEQRQNALLGRVEAVGLNELVPCLLPQSQEAQLEMLRDILEESSQFIETVSEQMNQAAKAMDTQVTSFRETTREATEVFSNMLFQARSSAEKLGSSIEQMASLEKEIHGVYSALMERHDKAEAGFSERVQTLLNAMQALSKGFNTNTASILSQLTNAVASYETSAKEFETAGNHFRNMSKEIGTEAYAAIAATANEFREALLAHKQAVDQVEAGMRELMARLGPAA